MGFLRSCQAVISPAHAPLPLQLILTELDTVVREDDSPNPNLENNMKNAVEGEAKGSAWSWDGEKISVRGTRAWGKVVGRRSWKGHRTDQPGHWTDKCKQKCGTFQKKHLT